MLTLIMRCLHFFFLLLPKFQILSFFFVCVDSTSVSVLRLFTLFVVRVKKKTLENGLVLLWSMRNSISVGVYDNIIMVCCIYFIIIGFFFFITYIFFLYVYFIRYWKTSHHVFQMVGRLSSTSLCDSVLETENSDK